MTGQHGCGGWKKSKSTKGFYKRTQNDTGKWYTQTSTRTAPDRRRGIAKTWTGAEQRGMNVYLSGGAYGGVWFEYKGTGHSTGDDSYLVHGLDGTLQTQNMLEYFGIPYNKIWTDKTSVYGIKVPGSALLNVGWPWSSKLGYPTQYKTIYWIWEVGGQKTVATEEEYNTWFEYLDIIAELNFEEMHEYENAFRKGFEKNNQSFHGMITDAISSAGGTLALAEEYNRDLKDYYEEIGWTSENVQAAQKAVLDYMWGMWWDAVKSSSRGFNELWWRYWGYYEYL